VEAPEDPRLFNLAKENSALLKRVAELEEQSQKLVAEHEQHIQEKQVDLASLQQQNQFLESLLEKKASAATSEYHAQEPELQKKLDDQEYLIRGVSFGFPLAFRSYMHLVSN
jgi:hypothetical protein